MNKKQLERALLSATVPALAPGMPGLRGHIARFIHMAIENDTIHKAYFLLDLSSPRPIHHSVYEGLSRALAH